MISGRYNYQLESGFLLIMLPGCQEDWVNAVPKTARPVGERINWTFRPHVEAIDEGETQNWTEIVR